MSVRSLNVEIYADGADLEAIRSLVDEPLVRGFTTNPTLMRQAGVDDYEKFARQALELVDDRPISFEVFTDDVTEMGRQADLISSWGANVFVKIPVTNTRGESTTDLVRSLTQSGVRVNVTAVFTMAQVEPLVSALSGGAPANISIFAGRIADAGIDPCPIVAAARDAAAAHGNIKLIWASPREVLNIVQADAVGCHIITVTTELLRKAAGLGKDLTQFSLETVAMFYRDAQAAGYTL